MKLIDEGVKSQLRTDLPEFGTGDNIDVSVRVVEGDKERVQVFSGTVIQRRGSGASETFTVRKISAGIGVERIFPINSPMIAAIKKNHTSKIRRSKLFYLRKLRGKAARLKRDYS
ncbi:MAG: 50S ribosomal protein L19 [Candidatus Latescibacteria bacterium]|nr:50S ribosomal protein L19 [Candidatus Latescibacterota bacterium]